MYEQSEPLVLFDGVCNLCTGAVQFIIKRDKNARFRFSSLQSETGQAILERHNMKKEGFDTFILLDKGKLYTQSGAALRVVRRLNGLWPLLYGFIVVPPFIRNGVYAFISKNRYRWFGKKDQCMIPTPEIKARFI